MHHFRLWLLFTFIVVGLILRADTIPTKLTNKTGTKQMPGSAQTTSNPTKVPYNNGFYAGDYNPSLPVIDTTADGEK